MNEHTRNKILETNHTLVVLPPPLDATHFTSHRLFSTVPKEYIDQLSYSQIRFIIANVTTPLTEPAIGNLIGARYREIKEYFNNAVFVEVLEQVRNNHLKEFTHIKYAQQKNRIAQKNRILQSVDHIIEQRQLSVDLRAFSMLSLTNLLSNNEITQEEYEDAVTNNYHDKSLQRKAQPQLLSVAGMDTGIVNSDGTIDREIVATVKELGQDIARELGQIVERSETKSQNLTVMKHYVEVSPDDV